MSVAKRRAIDGWRRRERMAQREPLFVSEALHAESIDTVPDEADPDHIDDDVLRLVFVACHPVLPAQARLALTLRTVAGLTTEQIARALLMTVPTVQQRIVRAKRALATEGVPFEVPDRAERPARLASVLQVIYLLFTEGYSATEGEGLVRPDVAREAVRLGRQLAALMPREPEIWSLIALMEFQSSRFAARIDAEGLPLTLEQQDRRRWDRSAIARGNEAIARAAPDAGIPARRRRHGPLCRPRHRVLRTAGGHRTVPRGGSYIRRDRLAADPRPLRRARRARSFGCGPPQPRRRTLDGGRPRAGSRRGGVAPGRAIGLPTAARRPGGAPRTPRRHGCRSRCVPRGRRSSGQRRRDGAPPASGGASGVVRATAHLAPPLTRCFPCSRVASEATERWPLHRGHGVAPLIRAMSAHAACRRRAGEPPAVRVGGYRHHAGP